MNAKYRAFSLNNSPVVITTQTFKPHKYEINFRLRLLWVMMDKTEFGKVAQKKLYYAVYARNLD